jgi:hypothetical protein
MVSTNVVQVFDFFLITSNSNFLKILKIKEHVKYWVFQISNEGSL